MSESLLDDDSIHFLILINDEQQYSIWPNALHTPSGWSHVEGPMPRQQCMDWLGEHWTDLRPQSLTRSSQAPSSKASQ